MIHNGVKQAFTQQFKLGNPQGTTFDLVQLYEIKGGLLAKVEVVTLGTQDHYSALRLTIISPKVGEIDTHVFKFNDYLSFDPKDRADTRTDYKEGFHVWANGNSFDWYIAKPKSVEPLTTAVRCYIEHFVQE